MLMPPSEGERHGTHSGCLVNSIYMPRSVHADMGVLSQITENRKVEARKPLIFQDAVFEFYLEKATLRQSPVQHPLLALQQAWTAMRPRISTISEGLLPRSRRAMSDTATSPCRSPLDR